MRGDDRQSGSLFSYVDLKARMAADHPLRPIRTIVNDALSEISGEFEALYSHLGQPSIPPERLLRALLLQGFYSIRSERLLMEQLEHNLLFRWFVGLGIDDPVCTGPPLPPTATACLRATSRPSSWRRF